VYVTSMAYRHLVAHLPVCQCGRNALAARRFICPYVEVIALHIDIKQLLGDDVTGIFKPHWFTGEHTSQHPLKPLVVGCNHATG
jgi:hypothetical protein